MQKSICAMALILLGGVLFTGCSLIPDTSSEISPPVSTPVAGTSTPLPTKSPAATDTLPTNFTAHFEIFTRGTRRIFTDAKYHNQSAEVYIEKADPHRIVVKSSGITWRDFFETLPFSLEKDCLITGTNQTFCTTETEKLYFYLNNEETPNALDRVIQPDDSLRVEYKTVTS